MTTHSESNVVLDLGQAILKLKEEAKTRKAVSIQKIRAWFSSVRSDAVFYEITYA